MKKANYLSIYPVVLPINRLEYNKKEVKIIHKKELLIRNDFFFFFDARNIIIDKECKKKPQA